MYRKKWVYPTRDESDNEGRNWRLGVEGGEKLLLFWDSILMYPIHTHVPDLRVPGQYSTYALSYIVVKHAIFIFNNKITKFNFKSLS